MTEDTPLFTSKLTVPGDITVAQIGPARVNHSPTAWRLARRNGELILQAGSMWSQGKERGVEWNDVPTVNLDELEVSG
jgi:hypothetical protein